jgi:predicted ATPase
MVDRDIVRYSLREKRWTYDIDAVIAEEVPTKVVDFIVSKMTNLTKEMQSALKVTSCFGTQVDLIVVKTLSSTSQYPRLYLSMKELVEKSLIDFDGSRFRFIHDRVREAAYNLIANDERDQFHFFIGVLLQTGFRSELQLNESDLLFIVIEQLHHGIPALVTSSSHQIAIAELYLKAGSKRFVSSFEIL